MEHQRILLAEDNPEMSKRVLTLLKSHFDIVGSVADGQQAIDSVFKHSPDILVSDLSMPILNGMEVALHLRDSGYCGKIIFLTVHEDNDYVEAAFSIGVFGYVLKSRLDTDLIPAIQAALQGRKFASQFLATTDLSEIHEARRS
jgi:DNA-binding NarL/FixJ family response regulator